MSQESENATLGGGCFWCLEAVFEHVQGVSRVVSGYTGGHVDSPSYREVCDGQTGHAEVVQVTFDPRLISFSEILEIFFAIHDPTTRDRQGNDVGPQYRSAIFYQSPEQKAAAEETIRRLTSEKVFAAPIVTEITPLTRFYPAEDYHQRYFRDNAQQPYCQYVIAPKIAKFRQHFSGKMKN